ncbi:MAG: DegT/DnrJ/EryC1/StrS family aminotransferase [bacterium]|nr:DegT/DnrJ/EryC1/StrS family aminotransferase [bacterium]
MVFESKIEELKSFIEEHRAFRNECLNLIASENTPSPFVEGLIAEDLNRRYGYYSGMDPQNQAYQGSRYVAKIEGFAQDLARDLFNAQFVDLRALSGNIAGIITMFALGSPGDTVLEVQNAHTYAEKLSTSGLKVDLRPIPIPWDGVNYNIDLDKTLGLIEKHKPKLVVLGSAMFLFPQPIQEIKEAMEKYRPGSYLIYDAAHVMGLIAGGRFQSPLTEGADVLITSTHKTLAGPQGGMILTNDRQIAERIAKATSPLMIANHHLARVPALAATFLEWKICGSAYADAIVRNAKALGKALHEQGVPMVGEKLGYTESHTLLAIVDVFGAGKIVADRLESCNIIAGATGVPEELGHHGLRIGVQEVTRYGMTEADAEEIAGYIVAGMEEKAGVKEKVIEWAGRFKKIQFTVENR